MKRIIVFCVLVSVSVASAEYSDTEAFINTSSPSFLQDDTTEPECREYHSLDSKSDVCHFINSTNDCRMDGGFIDYLKFTLCNTKSETKPAVYILLILWLFFLFIALGTTAESFLCPALEFIAHNLKLSHNIAGVTVVAFGNGAPDIFSAVAAFTNSTPGSTGVAIGALLGAGVFVTTVVAGAVSISKPFRLAQRPFLRDLTFYIATVFWTFCLLYKGKITLYNSIGFLLLYLVYVIVVLVGRSINQWMRKKEDNNTEINYNERTSLLNEPTPDLVQTDENGDWIDQPLRADLEDEPLQQIDEAGSDSDEESECEDITDENTPTKFHSLYLLWRKIRPISLKKFQKMPLLSKVMELCQVPVKLACKLTVPVIKAKGGPRDWCRTLYCWYCIVTPIFCVFGAKVASVKLGKSFPLWALMLIIGVAAALVVRFTSKENTRPVYYWVFAYIGFVASIIWTYSIANEIVNLLRTFGAILDVSNVIMGLTLLAWGNSIGDMVADVTLARQGFPRMAISACFGGPFFNLVIGVGLPCTIATITNGHALLVEFTTVEAVLAGSLLFALVFSYIVLPLRAFYMTKAYGLILIVIYIIYLPIVLLSGVGIIS